jgi:N-acetylglutamate synthase-like GNAT family acetyltransferase
MYVRDARNRDEAWLIDHIEAMGLDDAAFRSREFAIAVDEETDDRVGFARLRVHTADGEEAAEITTIGVLDGWRGQGVGAHVIERLHDEAGDEGFDAVYALVSEPEYLAQFGFEPIDAADLPAPLADRLDAKREADDGAVVPLRLETGGFEMPDELRQSFKTAAEAATADDGRSETAEDFGIDPDEATYKYDTGR